jgi:NADH dehydrogenase (ubiquinone) Fe-S protein 2
LGPQHPSTHGVLRICCFVKGENIKWIEAEIGLLHRGTEKLIELRNWNQSINYFNRLDYVSLVAQEEIYCYTIEKSLNLRISHLSSLIRVIFLEISRIFNHLLAVVTHAIDIGAFSPFLWAFEEREKLIEFYEASWGARMHTPYIIPGKVSIDIPYYSIDQIYKWNLYFPIKLMEIHKVITNNRIIKIRLADVAILNKKMLETYGLTGVIMRGSNIKKDLRLFGYSIYSIIQFAIN